MVVRVNVGETRSRVEKFMADNGYTLPTLIDLNSRVARKYNVNGHPHTLLIDSQGELVAFAMGARRWVNSEALAYFDQLIKS